MLPLAADRRIYGIECDARRDFWIEDVVSAEANPDVVFPDDRRLVIRGRAVGIPTDCDLSLAWDDTDDLRYFFVGYRLVAVENGLFTFGPACGATITVVGLKKETAS